MRSVTWRQVMSYRLRQHWLVSPAPVERLTDVVGTVCGIHAQVMASAELSIGMRVAGIGKEVVRRALWEERTLIKTTGLRGTLHLFPAAELGLWLSALGANTRPKTGGTAATSRVDRPLSDRISTIMCEVLDGRCMTKAELGAEVVEQVGPDAAAGIWPAFGGMMPRWEVVLSEAQQAGLLCYGPSAGTSVSFVRLDQWVGPVTLPDGHDALREVVRRYLHAYGPATYREFAQWFTMAPPAARALMDGLIDESEAVDVEGDQRWALAADLAVLSEPATPAVHLMPSFDCYVVGSHPRDSLIPPPVAAWALAHAATPARATSGRPYLAGPLPVLLVDGVVAGLWQRRVVKDTLGIRVEPFEPMTPSGRQALERAAEHVAWSLGGVASLEVGPVEVRAHL
ncbi:MAG: winged helix DNA-binding domain-containing protein [Candidatus Limnocylindrales bacterium]